MSAIAPQITCVSIVCSTVGSGADQRKHQSSASLAFVPGIHRWPVNSPHKGPVTRKMFPFVVITISSGNELRPSWSNPDPIYWCIFTARQPLCNMVYPSETYLKLKSREVSFAHNVFRNCPVILKFCTSHDSDTAVRCSKFQNDWTTDGDAIHKRDFVRFVNRKSFWTNILYCTALSLNGF